LNKFDRLDLYAALMHELKNNLGLLALTIDSIPIQGHAEHDRPLDEARLLCQRVVDRLQQALLVYKDSEQAIVPSVDAYSPRDLLHELRDTADSLARGRLLVDMALSEEVPEIWFFDRDLVGMALMNAIHNSIGYAQSRIRISAALMDQGLELSVWDDSSGFPEHILHSISERRPYRATGTGLGLQFAQLIAEAHENRGRRGVLHLSNAKGAVFSLLLP
jgi:K+-sensing histidine kinase KdpD